MDPRTDKNAFLSPCLLTIRVFVLARDDKVLASVTSKCPGQSRPVEEVLAGDVPLDPGEVLL